MNLPTEDQCLQYFEDYVVPTNIYNHCLKVRDVAFFLAKELKEQGVDINLELVKCTALLHDLFKMVSLKSLEPTKHHSYIFSNEEREMWKKLREKYPQMYEGEVAHLVFKEQYPELAIALKNVSNPRLEKHTWEELVVHYADSRVFKENVVLVEDRLNYLKEAYPKAEGIWDGYYQKIKAKENKIFTNLNLTPNKLKEAITE